MNDHNRTVNGFYLGDVVEFLGERSHIVNIDPRIFQCTVNVGNHRYYKAQSNLVKLADGRRAMDIRLTRVG